MTLEVGTSVQKVIAMILAAGGGFYLLQNGHPDAAIAIFTGIGVYAFGESNGKRIERKQNKGYLHQFTGEELEAFAREKDEKDLDYL